jgi:hypothetical protein
MPAFATHYLFAKSILERTDAVGFKDMIEKCPQAFFWGAQGPDIFLYYSPILGNRRILQFSKTLHSGDANLLFCLMYGYIEKHDFPAVLAAYLSGYLCHYSLDYCAHPYVYYHEEKLQSRFPGTKPSSRHAFIESQLDTLICGKLVKGGIRNFPIRNAVSCGAELVSEVHALYCDILLQIAEASLSRKQMEKCFRDAGNFLPLLFSGKTYVRRLARLLETILGKPLAFTAHIRPESAEPEWLNEDHREWANLQNPESPLHSSFSELYDSAGERALRLLSTLECAMQSGHSPDFAAADSFDNGNYRNDE